MIDNLVEMRSYTNKFQAQFFIQFVFLLPTKQIKAILKQGNEISVSCINITTMPQCISGSLFTWKLGTEEPAGRKYGKIEFDYGGSVLGLETL